MSQPPAEAGHRGRRPVMPIGWQNSCYGYLQSRPYEVAAGDQYAKSKT
jgi:hypothetical protein